VFVYAIPTDTVETIKTRLLQMTKAAVAPENVKLIYNGSVMEPENTLSVYTTTDGDILHEIRCNGAFFGF
jgi:hypothetical protein